MYACHTSPVSEVAIQWSDSLLLAPLPGKEVNPGLAGAFSGVYGDHLIIAGGANFPNGLPWEGGKKVYHNDAYVYRFDNGSWQHQGIYSLADTLAYGAAVAINSGLLCLGGENERGITSGCVVLQYDSATNQILSSPFPSLPIPLTNLSAIAVDNKIYAAGGGSIDSVSNRMFVINDKGENPQWQELAPLPHPVSNFVMTNLGNQIFVVGGRCQQSDGISELYLKVYSYNIDGNKWTEKADLPYALSAGTGISLNDHQIILFGGDRGETFHRTEMFIKEINAGKDTVRKKLMVEEKNQLQRKHPGFSNVMLLYDSKQNKWTEAGQIPFAAPVTTIAIRFRDEVIIPSGEIKAGIRSPHILTGYIKNQSL